MEKPYNQLKKDSNGYFLSFSFIFGLIAIGSGMRFLEVGGDIGFTTLVSGAACIIFFKLASDALQQDYNSGRLQDPRKTVKKRDTE